ncbi:ammonium transporter [Rubricoccus marinus]|uniref:Ammonium transporter n=1 Tax=Rubricoccus marinus TaxID=716817 RepID=A0A259TW27_9BACT|nr:ammonium transporter [Rubricoccus marinus]OZC01784.1 ammonium transporter [Rubricoccus marinus]
MKRLACLAFLFAPTLALAQDALPPEAAAVQVNLDYVWIAVCAAMVFLMQAGFALLETGLTRAKNAANIIMKNVMDASAGAIVFFVVGFGLMFGPSAGGLIGTSGFGLTGLEGEASWTYLFFFFQAVFAATAATIVSGAVAERVNFAAYLVVSVVLCAFIYPIFGGWAWGSLFAGGGWLEGLGFHDFAGSTVVHSVGGWAALAGAIAVGPRADKYDETGAPREIPGHSLPLAALGVFILWFGWFGFNAGSTGAGSTALALIAVNTFLSAAAGALAAMAYTWVRGGMPDVGQTLNGVLAGLVGITAGCDVVAPIGALAVGGLAGVLVVVATGLLERRGVDDPVSAVAVHGVCGAWGTLAVALFASSGPSLAQFGVQAVGVGAAFAWTFPLAFGLFKLLDATMGLRIDRDVEQGGLDLHEHGTVAYPEFVPFSAATSASGDSFSFTTTSGDGAIVEPTLALTSSTALERPAPTPMPALNTPWLAAPPTWNAYDAARGGPG